MWGLSLTFPLLQSALTGYTVVSFRCLHLFQKACSLVFCLSCPLFQGLGLDRLRFCLWEGESKVALLALKVFMHTAGWRPDMSKNSRIQWHAGSTLHAQTPACNVLQDPSRSTTCAYALTGSTLSTCPTSATQVLTAPLGSCKSCTTHAASSSQACHKQPCTVLSIALPQRPSTIIC